MAVTVDLGSLRRAWRKAGDGEFVWEFVPEPVGDVLDEVSSAVVAANDAVEYGQGAFAEAPSDTGRGVAALLLGEGDVENARWFDLLRLELEGRGLSGTVAAAREASYPRWAHDFTPAGRVLTACVGFPLDPAAKAALIRDGISRLPLGIAPEVTRDISGIATDWARLDIAELPYIRRDLFLARTSDEHAAADLAAAAQRSAAASVAWVSKRPQTMRFVSFDAMGGLLVQIVDHSATWQQSLEVILELVRDLADRADLAYIKLEAPLMPSWSADPFPPSPAPHAEAAVAHGPRLRSYLVPDAHGVQVLTDRHLERARELAEWQIEGLGAGKYLVTHRDLAAWYSSAEPDADVLARARADFGSMIATVDDISGDARGHMF